MHIGKSRWKNKNPRIKHQWVLKSFKVFKSYIVPTFQYFDDIIGEPNSCVDATSTHITAAWKGFRQLFCQPLLIALFC